MKKLFLFSLVFLFLITSVQAVTITPVSPTTLPHISMMCGEIEIVDLKLSLSNENVSVTFPIKYTLSGLYTGFDKTYFSVIGNGDRHLHISFFTQDDCTTGTETRTLHVGDKTYDITVTVSQEQHKIFEDTLFENEKLSLGSDVDLILLDVGDEVKYKLNGCGDGNNREILQEGGSKDYECGGESLTIELVQTFNSINAGAFKISASKNWLTSISESDEGDYDDGECELGFSTGGFLVKRGQSLIGTTINKKTGEYRPNVIVKIVDPMAEVPMVTIQSDQFGSVQQPLSGEYKGLSLALSLSMPIDSTMECLASTNNKVDFDKTYTDYLKEKSEEEGASQLVLNMSGRFVMGAISNTVKNALGEAIEGATVRVTFPDNSYIDMTTDANGGFSFIPTQIGIHKLQTSKDEYTPSVMCEIEVYLDKTYLIVIKVNGEQKAEYKKGDRISFELRDINNTILPLSVGATFAGVPLNFVAGISDVANFMGTSNLDIPAVEGYIAQSITLSEKTTDKQKILMWVIGIIMGLVVLVIIVAIIKKVKGGSGKPQQMEFQMGPGGN